MLESVGGVVSPRCVLYTIDSGILCRARANCKAVGISLTPIYECIDSIKLWGIKGEMKQNKDSTLNLHMIPAEQFILSSFYGPLKFCIDQLLNSQSPSGNKY